MTNPNETFLSRTQQAARWNVSKRSVERWGEDEELGLPPEIEINGRCYRKLSEIEVWERKRAVAAAAKRAERKERNPEADVADPSPACPNPPRRAAAGIGCWEITAQAADGHPVASGRVSFVLAMEVALSRRQTEGPA